jgi:UDP:flavonoid glycosyltransferase YjiC (YdhE family)
MRILFSTWPAHGHLLPLLPLVRAAQRGGHQIVVASGAEGAAEAARRGLPTWDIGPSRAQADAAFRDVVPDLSVTPPEERIPTVIAGMFGAAAFTRAKRLVPRAMAWEPDVVVHSISELAGAIAAARSGARHVVHGLGPLPPEAWTWFGSRFADLSRTWGVPELATNVLDAPYIDLCPPSLQPDAVAAFRNRRAMQPSPGELIDGERLPWDDARLRALPHDRTIHLTLGTLFHGATGVFETALEGLRPLPVNVIVALGPGADPARLGPQPPNVLVADFLPHAALLPRCDALVTQGGAGTILAALCCGLPHLILPQGADQFVNATTAERAGVALQIRPPDLTPAAVTAAVERLLDDPRIGANTRRIQTEITTMPTADDVLADLLADPYLICRDDRPRAPRRAVERGVAAGAGLGGPAAGGR